MFPRLPTKSPRAFSLAELLVCLTVVAIAVLGLLGAQAYALRCGQYNRWRQTASTLAASELTTVTEEVSQQYIYAVNHTIQPVPGFPAFQSACDEIYLYPPSETIRQLNVSVYWTDQTGSQEYQVATYVYQPF